MDTNKIPPVPNMTENSPVTPVQPEQPVVTEASPKTTNKISPSESIKIRMAEVKSKLGVNDPRKVKKIILIVAGIFLVLILLVVGYSLLPKQVATPLATLTPLPLESGAPVGVPSEYADDPELLRIMDALQVFSSDVDQTKLREDELRLPTVDWNVSF